MENSLAGPQKIKNRTTRWSNNPTSEYISKELKYLSKRYLYTHFHSHIIQNRQEVKAI